MLSQLLGRAAKKWPTQGTHSAKILCRSMVVLESSTNCALLRALTCSLLVRELIPVVAQLAGCQGPDTGLGANFKVEHSPLPQLCLEWSGSFKGLLPIAPQCEFPTQPQSFLSSR